MWTTVACVTPHSAFRIPHSVRMILLIDNYDSFTYNLVQRLGEIDPSLDLEVHRNDQITLDEIERKAPDAPDHLARPLHAERGGHLRASASRGSRGKMPILGVCLGHQSIGQATGGRDRPRRAADARQGRPHPPRRPGHVRRPAQPVRGHALPQPGHSARHAAATTS